MATSSLRHALRRLWRDRSTTIVALATLALGIGASTSLFTVVNAVLVKPLPYPAADRLVVLRLRDAEFRGRSPSSPANAAHIATWRDHCAGCEDVAAIGAMLTTLTGSGEAQQLDGARITSNFFA